MGVVLCDLHDKNQPAVEKDGVFPQKFHQLERFFDDLKSPCDLFEKVKISSFQVAGRCCIKTDKLLDVFILCTRTSHRGRGLAGQLVKTALENAKSEADWSTLIGQCPSRYCPLVG